MASFSYDAFDSHLHRAWKADRALRRRVPLHDAWRGCVGLAVLLDRPDDTEPHGELALVRNDQVTWLALRDVPVGRCPGSPVMNRRDVNYANTAKADLKYGMPVLDFTKDVRDAVDFRFMPIAAHVRRRGPRPWDVERVVPQPDTLDCARRAREFAVLNGVSAAMTAFAFDAVAPGGAPVRPAWAARRSDGHPPCRPTPPGTWMPRPLLSFPVGAVDPVRERVIGSAAGGHVPPLVRDAFCDTMAAGLELGAVGPEVYSGVVPGAGQRRPGDRVRHRLRSLVDGADQFVDLPVAARVTARAGDPLEPGEAWATVSPPSPAVWARVKRRGRWSAVVEACGGPGRAGRLLRLWFDAQAVRPAGDPGAILLPAFLVASSAVSRSPVALWWDTAAALPHFRWEASAFVFPPIPLRRWDALRLALPGDVCLNASIADPRFAAPGSGRPPRRGARSRAARRDCSQAMPPRARAVRTRAA